MIGSAAHAAEDKSRYTLFNPTPDRLLRDMSTDRPDMTESPFTVDAGRIQVETNLFGYARSHADADGTVTSAYEFATTNIRIGLTHDTEINVVWQPYGHVRSRALDPLASTRSAGIGGVDLRAKINLWGNDTFDAPGATALALLPFVTLPTNRTNGISPEHVEVGLIVPLGIQLDNGFGLGLNVGAHALKNEFRPGYHVEWLASASLAYDWSDTVGTYLEVATRLNTYDPRGDVVLVGVGMTYKLNDNLQLDAGVNFGVTKSAEQVNPFLGVSARF